MERKPLLGKVNVENRPFQLKESPYGAMQQKKTLQSIKRKPLRGKLTINKALQSIKREPLRGNATTKSNTFHYKTTHTEASNKSNTFHYRTAPTGASNSA